MTTEKQYFDRLFNLYRFCEGYGRSIYIFNNLRNKNIKIYALTGLTTNCFIRVPRETFDRFVEKFRNCFNVVEQYEEF